MTRRVIKGTLEEKVQQILDGAPGMSRSAAEAIVREHDRLGFDEIVEEMHVMPQPESITPEELEELAELIRGAEEAFGATVIRDGEQR